MADPYTGLRADDVTETIRNTPGAEPMVCWRNNEAAIVARLRVVHADDYADGYDWGTWANVMRVRNGDPPQRTIDRNMT